MTVPTIWLCTPHFNCFKEKSICKNLMLILSFKNQVLMSVLFSHSQIYFPSRIYLLFKLFSPPYPWWWEVPTGLWGMLWEVEFKGRSTFGTAKVTSQPCLNPNASHKPSTPMASPQTFPILACTTSQILSNPALVEHCVNKALVSTLNIFTPGYTHPANLLITLDCLFHLPPLLLYLGFWEL